MNDFRFASAESTTPSPTTPASVEQAEPIVQFQQPQPVEPVEVITNSAVQLVDNILDISQKLRTLLQQHYAEFDLNEVRYTVLQFINQTKEAGCSQSELAEKLQQSESSVSTLIERMKNSELIYPLRSKQDRRKRILVLTELGRELLHRIEKCHATRMRNLLDKLQLAHGHELEAAVQELDEKLSTVSSDWFKQSETDQTDSSQAA